jgi:hypothetical protein
VVSAGSVDSRGRVTFAGTQFFEKAPVAGLCRRTADGSSLVYAWLGEFAVFAEGVTEWPLS